MARADFITSIMLLAFGIGVLVVSLEMPTFAARGVNPYSAPGIVPGFLGGTIAVLGAVLFVRSLLRRGHRLGIDARTVKGFFTSQQTLRLAITVVVSILYALVLLGRMPYPAATAVYVFLFIVLFEYRWKQPLRGQWKIILSALLVAVVTAGLVTLVFEYLFLVSLPG